MAIHQYYMCYETTDLIGLIASPWKMDLSDRKLKSMNAVNQWYDNNEFNDERGSGETSR